MPSNLVARLADVLNHAKRRGLVTLEGEPGLFLDHVSDTQTLNLAYSRVSVFMTVTLTQACTKDRKESENDLTCLQPETQTATHVDPREILLAAQVSPTIMRSILS